MQHDHQTHDSAHDDDAADGSAQHGSAAHDASLDTVPLDNPFATLDPAARRQVAQRADRLALPGRRYSLLLSFGLAQRRDAESVRWLTEPVAVVHPATKCASPRRRRTDPA